MSNSCNGSRRGSQTASRLELIDDPRLPPALELEAAQALQRRQPQPVQARAFELLAVLQ